MASKDTITVTWGEELYAPYRYNHFKVGPFTYTTTVQDGETPEQAFTRAYKFLEAHVEKVFLRKRNQFKELHGVLNQ